jgi:hypothetical protein
LVFQKEAFPDFKETLRAGAIVRAGPEGFAVFFSAAFRGKVLRGRFDSLGHTALRLYLGGLSAATAFTAAGTAGALIAAASASAPFTDGEAERQHQPDTDSNENESLHNSLLYAMNNAI